MNTFKQKAELQCYCNKFVEFGYLILSFQEKLVRIFINSDFSIGGGF